MKIGSLLFLCTVIFCSQTTRSDNVLDDKSKKRESREIFLQLRGRGTDEAEKFVKIANSFHPVTDKVTKHKYFLMYGRYLVPVAELHKKEGMKPLKFLEIGLGCNMEYGNEFIVNPIQCIIILLSCYRAWGIS